MRQQVNTLKISDLFSDTPLVLKEEDGKYYEVHFSGEAIDGWDTPILTFLKKGKRIYKKDLGILADD